MEITLGPFDPALHVRSRDHYEAVRRALDATTQLQQLFDQFDRWAAASRNQLFEAPDEVKRYRRTYLAQLRSQLAAAG